MVYTVIMRGGDKMLSVKEVSSLTGISVRTLHYYDEIGLLKPSEIADNGYRMYDDNSLDRLQQILLYRELEFSLKDIKRILDSPGYDRKKELERQIELLTVKKEHLENLILFARGIKILGVRAVDFSVFDTKKLDEYAQRAKESFNQTEAYKEFEQKSQGRSKDDEKALNEQLMTIFAQFGEMLDLPPDCSKVRSQVEKLRLFITDNFYNCTPQMLIQLGKMYSGGGEMSENIDKFGGKGTADFVGRAIENICRNM